ncbi:MAG: mycofactocin system glycosyltransferase [Chloroflexi bacterium RBG_16_60_22]|nr:MAG: mycofactocin system glycosyltransferase [Chloroflexi bacterium RBG_16_60_22]
MKGFGFSLADGASLLADPGGYYLLSRLPIRILRLNRSLYRLLTHIQESGGLADFIAENPGLEEGQLLRTLFSLVARGYLKLERLAEPGDYPKVSIIIPVRDQPEDLAECLKSLEALDYPKEQIEIIVVDDGSEKEVAPIVPPGVRVIRQAVARGPAAGRNTGAAAAGGEILAFLDADCTAGKDWLKEIVPFFRTATVGAVGGYVDGYYQESFLDRYEAVASSLNLGKRLLIEGRTGSSFYVPTANMLVTREAFKTAGGFKAGMHVGEDVDFCWRMRDLGYSLLYVPFGRVAHKHRHRLGKMLKRRGDYGTSEAALYGAHREKRKTFLAPVYTGLSFLAATLAVLLLHPYPLAAALLLFGLDLWQKTATLKKYKTAISFGKVAAAAFRSYLSLFYFAFFHLVRYYLILIIALGFWLHPLWLFGGLAIVYTSIVDYTVKKPDLNYPVFLFLYLLEHLAYQVGVFRGCLKQRYFGSYLLSFKRA